MHGELCPFHPRYAVDTRDFQDILRVAIISEYVAFHQSNFS